jgi:hypothetical protein
MRGNEYKALGNGPRLQHNPDDTTCKRYTHTKSAPPEERRVNRAPSYFRIAIQPGHSSGVGTPES